MELLTTRWEPLMGCRPDEGVGLQADWKRSADRWHPISPLALAYNQAVMSLFAGLFGDVKSTEGSVFGSESAFRAQGNQRASISAPAVSKIDLEGRDSTQRKRATPEGVSAAPRIPGLRQVRQKRQRTSSITTDGQHTTAAHTQAVRPQAEAEALAGEVPPRLPASFSFEDCQAWSSSLCRMRGHINW